MLGMSLLNEIVDGKGVTEPAQILNILRKGIISALQQKGALDEQKDGMDISMISIDFEKNQLQWAGANNPLWIVRKTEDEVQLIEIKADKMPVAIHEKMPDFTNHSMEFFIGDRFFIFSDGFADQFGGENNKKFMSKNLKIFFTANYYLNMNELMLKLNQAFADWQGENSQVDDVTVIGIEL
jgi:serine phosphatase RsbU (regulator of sigma subunit)